MKTEIDKQKQEDANLQFIVLLNLIIERIEYLEKHGYIYGSIKSFLKNGKNKFENFILQVFKIQNEKDSLLASSKILIMQERTEKALQNEYLISVDERKQRANDILNKYMISTMAEKAIEEMEQKNLFNF